MKFFNLAGLRPRRSGIAVACVCLLAALTGSLPALSQEAALLEKVPLQSIDLNYALQQTLQKNAELKAYPYYLRVSEAELLQAKQRPLPILGLIVENVLGSGDFSDADQAEITLTLGQTIELGGETRKPYCPGNHLTSKPTNRVRTGTPRCAGRNQPPLLRIAPAPVFAGLD